MKQGAFIERFAVMVDLLVRAPRTAAEICDELDMNEQSIRRWLKSLHATGRLTKVEGPKRHLSGPGKGPALWVWKP